MTWARWVRLLGIFLLILWGTYVVVVISAFAGQEAAERGEPRPSWVTPSPHPGPPPR